MPEVLFEEKRKYTLRWVRVPIMATTAAVLIPVTLSFAKNWPAADDSGKSAEIILAAVMTYGSFTALYRILLRACLETRISASGISYRFPPFIRNWRYIPKSEVKAYTEKQCNPATVDGGRALHIYGNHALHVAYGENKKQLIGTRKPEALKAALQKMMQSEMPASASAN